MLRGALVSMIYTKTLSLAPGVTTEQAPVTLMSTDVDGIAGAFQGLHDIWASLLEVGIGLWLLKRELGISSVVPVVFTIGKLNSDVLPYLSMPLGSKAVVPLACTISTIRISKLMGRRQATWNKAVQQRVAITSSALGSMKSVKLMGLTERLSADIQRLRVAELDVSKKFRMLVVWINVTCL